MRGMKLSVKLPALIVLSVLMSTLIIFTLGAYVTRNSLRAVEMEANSNSVHAYANAASFYLEEASSTLEITAALPQITDFASAGLVAPALHGVPADVAMAQRNIAISILKHSNIFDDVQLLKPDGTIYLLEPYDLQVNALSGSRAASDWYKELMSSGNTVISALHISNVTRRPVVTIATPVRNSAGQVIGILAGGLKLEAFSQMARAEPEAGTPLRYGYITDSRGLIIAHQANPRYVQEQTDFSSVPPVRAALAGQDGTMQYICPIDGQEELGAHMPLPGTGWAVVYVVPAQIAFAPLTQLTYTTMSITVVIAIIVTIVGLAIVRQITRPLGQLTAAAVKMGTGDLSQRVKVTTRDEIGQLGTEFNRMAVSLSEKEAKLRDYAAQLEQKVEERTVELTRSNADLAQFAYVASHDLQEPLRMVSSYMQLIEQRYKDKLDAAGTEFMNYAVNGATRMQTMINDLLTFSRVGTRGKPFEPTDCEVILDQTLANLQMAIEESQAIITHDPLPTVMSDDTQIVLLFQNLIGNAVKFRTQEQMRVHISAQAKGREWVFSVRDNGIGIDPQYFERLFVIFQRLHSKEEYPGTGIGLAVCKRVVERHGGKIWVESQPGQGSTFYFAIPKKGGK
jgi:signal transduction histidine kinase